MWNLPHRRLQMFQVHPRWRLVGPLPSSSTSTSTSSASSVRDLPHRVQTFHMSSWGWLVGPWPSASASASTTEEVVVGCYTDVRVSFHFGGSG